MDWLNDTGNNDFTGYEGFIYRIDYTDGSYYFGKKTFIERRKKNFGKKELAKVTDKRLKTYHMIVKESDWRTYEGSCKDVGDRIIAKKTILMLCKTKYQLTFREEELLFNKQVLADDMCLNKCIGGKYWRTVYSDKEK